MSLIAFLVNWRPCATDELHWPCGLMVGMVLMSTVCGAVDLNGDGICDVWARAYGAEGSAAAADTDGDGVSTLEEAIAGTDPFDANSKFQVTRVQRVVDGMRLWWQAVEGRAYRVETTTDPTTGAWSAGEVVEAGLGGERMVLVEKSQGHSLICRLALVERAAPAALGRLGLWFDSDGDGQTDELEFRAGTDPFDASSRFAIQGIGPAAGVVLDWSTVPGKAYQVQSRSFNAAGWVDEGGVLTTRGDRLSAWIEGANAFMELQVTVRDMDANLNGVSDWSEGVIGVAGLQAQPMAGHGKEMMRFISLLAEPVRYEVTARRPTVLVGGTTPGLIEIRRVGGLGPLKIPLVIGGDADSGVDYEPLPREVRMPMGGEPIVLPVVALPTARSGVTVELATDTEGGSMATVRLVRERALCVKDFGALGDGITDDSVAIQNAIDRLETSAEYNTLVFPEGTYRMGMLIYDRRTPTGFWRHLLLGGHDLSGRDLFLIGEPGAVLLSETGPVRTHTLVVDASMRSLTMRGLRVEQGSTPRVAVSFGNSPNGADGVSLVQHVGRVVEGVEFDNCEFRNCHGAIFTYGHGYDVRGSLKFLSIHHCRLLNPYGANTQDSGVGWGGGIQVGVSEWVATAAYDSNLFEGGGEDMTDSATCPGGRVKDGCHFGNPMRLEFSNNVVKRMGVEAVFQTNGNTYMGTTIAPFTIPPVDGSSQVAVRMDDIESTFLSGDTVNIRLPASPQGAGGNNLLRVVTFDASTRTVWVRNEGYLGNSEPGTVVAGDLPVYLNRLDEPSMALIHDNWLDGTLPPGAHSDTEPAGIVVNARSVISTNTITGFQVGVLIYPEGRTPLFPASRGTVMDHNTILTRNPRDYPGSYTHGIKSYANEDLVADNLVITPVTYRFTGFAARGLNSRVEHNTVISLGPAVNGYASADRGVGIGFDNQSLNGYAGYNTTQGMDVGVGPEDPYQDIPHRVSDHRSVNDVLPIDPVGLRP